MCLDRQRADPDARIREFRRLSTFLLAAAFDRGMNSQAEAIELASISYPYGDSDAIKGFLAANLLLRRLDFEARTQATERAAQARPGLLVGAGRKKASPRRSRRRQITRGRPLTPKQVEAVQIYGECKGNLTKAAANIGIDRTSFRERLDGAYEKLGQKRPKRQGLRARRLPQDRRGQVNITEDRRRKT